MQSRHNFTPLAVALAFAISAQASGQMSQAADLDLQASCAGSTLTCSPTPATIRVPPPLVARAKVKARLVTLLRDSLSDDTKGIVNIAREKEIKKLANKLSRESD